ncbi:ABATE domain-containing protein [Sinosporangium siamense]|uniref:ABATE domain-containing protein n=1 Tax=Sinosporangium siamense TaxID=1367973 RepID=UPI001950AE7D
MRSILCACIAHHRCSRRVTRSVTLRQAIWEAAHARAAGRPLPARAVATVNRAAADPRTRRRRHHRPMFGL